MKINRNNYEQYFIDHLDGRLDTSLVMELNQFLDKNPDLKEELESFETISTNLDDSYHFTDKDNLKKTVIVSSGKINSDNYEDFFIASFEGDLNNAEQIEVKTFIKLNPHLDSQFKMFSVSRLKAEDPIVFPDKKSLKKYPFWVINNWYKLVGIAASIILLFGLFNFLQPTSIFTKPTERIAVPSKVKSKGVSSFELSFNDPIPNPRSYQIKVTHTEERLPIEPLVAMSPIDVPLKSYIASLSHTIEDITFLTFKNDYDVLAKELMIKEELLLASYGETNPNAREKLEKALWAKSFGKQKRRKSREEKIGDENKKARVNLWTIASIGLEGFNELTGSNVNIERKLNKEGEKNKYILVNGNVSTPEVTDAPNKP